MLAKVVENLPTPSSFLLDTFFPNIQTSEKEEIFFDVTDSKPRITPFVSPLLPGKVVNGNGYQTKSFKPAYVKDKRRFDANIPFKRMAGETIGGNLSNAQRYERALATTLQDQLDNLTRREEVMAAEICVPENHCFRRRISGDNGRFWKRYCLNQSLSQRKHLVRCRF